MLRSQVMASILAITSLTMETFAQQPPGGDSYSIPPGGKAGTTVEVRLGGADWTPDVQFLVHDPRVKLDVMSKPGVVLMPESPFWFGIKSYANDPRLPREVSARFVLPANMPPGLIHWSVTNANGAGSGGVFVVSTGNEVIEDEGRSEPQMLSVLPVTVNGRLRRIEEVDRYRFVATHSGPITCDLMARRLGSDFLGAMEIQNAEGKQLAEVVDTEGVDPTLTFFAEKGKTYSVAIRDLDYRGYRNMTYRLTVTLGPKIMSNMKRPATGFQLRSTGIVNVPIGGKAQMTIRIIRDLGFKEAVTLSFADLPEGITTPKDLVILPTVDALPVTFECTKNATASAALVRVSGTAKGGGQNITQTLYADFQGDLTFRNTDVNLIPHVLVATTMKPPIKLKVAEADGGRRIPRGSTHLSEILIERTDGFNGEVLLDMAGTQQRHRQGIRGPALLVAPGVTRVDYPVFLPEWLETSRTSRIGLVALVQVPDSRGKLRYVMTPVEGQITMSVEGALMKLSHDSDELRVVVGRPLKIPLKLLRSQSLTEDVTVVLDIPAELKGLVSAKPLSWPKDKTAVDWRIETSNDFRLIGVQHLTARATTMKNNYAVVSETTFEVEFVRGAARNIPK